MKKLFLLTLLIALPIIANAYDIIVKNEEGVEIYYNYINNETELEVTSGIYYRSVNIPESVTYMNRTYNVTKIGDRAFLECVDLTSVTIPNSVTSIGYMAFHNCSRLSSVTIPNSVKIIVEEAFFGCTGLTSVTISNSVTSIGAGAFDCCRSLTSVTIPNSVKSIGDRAFSRCTAMTTVSIPNSITSIGHGAFQDCSGLTSVHITDIAAWCKISFAGGYSNPLYYAHHLYLNGEEIKDLVIPNGVTSIGDWAFDYCSGLTSVTIPNSVTSIGRAAFDYCSGLTSITIPNSVKIIVEGAFIGCNLTEVISMVESPFYINYRAFSENTYKYATLFVPRGTIEKYKSTQSWDSFHHIEEGNPFEHTLIYLVDGNTYASYILEEGDAITPDEAPTKEGYTFSGWSEIPETMPASDITITGTFVPNKYKLTYFVDGGEYKSSEVEFGSTIKAEENPTKEGYTFSGWSEIPETMPASDVTITGSFTINKYKLTYTLDGEEYKTAEVDYGTALTPEEAPVKEGYTFSGWSEIPETMPANDVTVTGTFTANKYKLTYMVDGEEYKASEVDYGTVITAEAVPTKEGYTFSGWSEIPSTMPAEDVTVTGTFTVNKYTITYKVDDAVLMTEEVAYGSTIAPPKSQKDGYDILWSFYPTTMPAYSITINGTYTTGISSLSMEEKDRQVFTPDGKRVETPKKGLNIIRMSDGTVKKVVAK